MLKYKLTEYDTEYGVLIFEIREYGAVLNSYHGKDAFIVIPEKINDDGKIIPVKGIERKAFLSDKYLVEVGIPGSVEFVGDWGFAGCTSLVSVNASSQIKLGKEVFKDCHSLMQIRTDEVIEKKTIDTGFLLVASDYLLKDRYLFDFAWAGSDDWYECWDRRMDTILSEHDDEGFISLVAGGEEDYENNINTLEGFISEKRKRKVRICFLRLLHDYALSNLRKVRLMEYLRNHRSGAEYYIDVYESGIGYCDNGYLGRTRTVAVEEVQKSMLANGGEMRRTGVQDEAWRVVCDEHADEAEYYHLLCECGCVELGNIEDMLNDLGEGHARMKALLFGFLEEHKTDWFENMSL